MLMITMIDVQMHEAAQHLRESASFPIVRHTASLIAVDRSLNRRVHPMSVFV